jgi:hypothetical protein
MSNIDTFLDDLKQVLDTKTALDTAVIGGIEDRPSVTITSKAEVPEINVFFDSAELKDGNITVVPCVIRVIFPYESTGTGWQALKKDAEIVEYFIDLYREIQRATDEYSTSSSDIVYAIQQGTKKKSFTIIYEFEIEIGV